ncbi:MAG: hypothetical protein P8179_12900 [Candidatus Thiodiazotropha sp.]
MSKRCSIHWQVAILAKLSLVWCFIQIDDYRSLLRPGDKAQRRGIARYSKELQRRHVPPQACYSRCSVIHPVGDHGYRSCMKHHTSVTHPVGGSFHRIIIQ